MKLEGRVKPIRRYQTEVLTPKINISENSDGSYFDINYEYLLENTTIKEAEVRKH